MRAIKFSVIVPTLIFMILSVACDPNVGNDSAKAETVITANDTHEAEFTIPTTELPSTETTSLETESPVSDMSGNYNPIDDSNLGEWN